MRPAPDPHPAAPDRAAVRAEMDQARADFRRLVSNATPADLRRPSDGTRWTNQQRPFHLINYLGSRAGARLIPPGRMTPVLDHVITALQQHLERETETALLRGMHYPVTWDPFFASHMTLADLYRYPTRHFRFH